MRPKKSPTVTLVVPKNGMVREFDPKHAERLLDLGELNGGWQLPEDSEYEYTVENGLKRKSD